MGGNPLVRKDAFDLQFHTFTSGNTADVEVWKDGNSTAVASYSVSTSQPQAYRIQASDVGAFIRAQLKLTGTFDEFQLSSLDMTYRVRPQHMTYLDTGYVIGDEPADIVWLQEVEVDANSPSDLWVQVYLDDRLFCSDTVSVTPNVRTVYRVPLPRGSKSRRPRIVVKTAAADGSRRSGLRPLLRACADEEQWQPVWGQVPHYLACWDGSVTLRIPSTPDATLRTGFEEIERRLRKLEQKTGITSNGTTVVQVIGGGGGSVNLNPILLRLEALEAALANLVSYFTRNVRKKERMQRCIRCVI